jgi:septum formation protein
MLPKFPHILLASKSPRRSQLLKEAGFDFTVVDIDADEDFSKALSPPEVCEYLAGHKAAHYIPLIEEKVLVTADTIVVLENEIINKPKDSDDAFHMLKKLSGKMHVVYTGVCIKNDKNQILFSDRTEVYFYTLTNAEIEAYIENFRPYDKAGAYGVQDWMGYIGVQKVNGSFYNVMGFPTALFYRKLIEFIES